MRSTAHTPASAIAATQVVSRNDSQSKEKNREEEGCAEYQHRIRHGQFSDHHQQEKEWQNCRQRRNAPLRTLGRSGEPSRQEHRGGEKEDSETGGHTEEAIEIADIGWRGLDPKRGGNDGAKQSNHQRANR